MLTGLLIVLLVIVGAATALAGGMALMQRRELSGGKPPKALPGARGGGKLLERTIRDLRPDDVLAFDGRDYLVEGVIAYEEDGHRWSAGSLMDLDDKRWLVVGLERGSMLTARVMKVTDEIEIEGFPPDTLMVGTTRYVMDKRGTATARLSGETGLDKGAQPGVGDVVQRCRFWLYETPGAESIIVEQWGDQYRVLKGEKINHAIIDMMPGS